MKRNKNRVLLRADGNSSIGMGHIMRLLGLFEFIKKEFNCFFLVKKPDIQLKKIIETYCEVIELKTSDIENEMNELNSILLYDDIVVLDGYEFNEQYQQYIKSKVHKLVMVDDIPRMHYYADLIINHGDVCAQKKYKRESYTKVLGGFNYLILRKEFLLASLVERKIAKVDSVFICMGGADPFNVTFKALRAAIACNFIRRIVLITGNSYLNDLALRGLITENAKQKEIIYEKNVNAPRLIELIDKCDIAICTASTIALEVCCVKAGILVGMVADNQMNLHKQLMDLDCVITMNNFNEVTEKDIIGKLKILNDVELVNRLIQNQYNTIDGKSGERIRQEFKSMCPC